MGNIDYGIDPELVFEFVDESQEMLSEVTNTAITLESDPTNEEAIDKIFRAVHTIKGNSAFFNLMKVKSLAHIMEDLMNLIREKVVNYNKEVADVMIQGIDALKGILENVRQQKDEVKDKTTYDALLQAITSQVDKGRQTDPVCIWKDLTNEINTFTSAFTPRDTNVKDAWERIVKSLGRLNPLSKENVTESGEITDNPKDYIEQQLANEIHDNLDQHTSDKILESLESLKKNVTQKSLPFVNEAIASYWKTVPQEGFTPFLAEIIRSKIHNVELKETRLETQKKCAREKDPAADIRSAKGEKEAITPRTKKTMRIYESSIDKFLDYVGELVVVGEMYGHIQKRFAENIGLTKDVVNLKKNNESFNDLSISLQRSVLNIRRIPIKTLTQRAPRIIHDVAKAKDKKININITGDETLIDKSLLEDLEGPFVHLLRNAADHGIEMPEKRAESGKSPEGMVWIDVTENDTSLFITIKDDGGGISKDVILDKALSKGLISKEQAGVLTEQETYDLLFAPGFSTAQEVTDISGRGVGMDVVKKNIEAIGGQIHIESAIGKGSTFKIEAPKAVAVKIMEGFLVETAQNRFVLPMKTVGESFVILEKEITKTLESKDECILHYDRVLPVVRLDEILEIRSSNRDDPEKERVGVIITLSKKDIVLIVDGVLGTQQVVIKEIEGLANHSRYIAGGVILGDERVAIVLNLESLNTKTIAQIKDPL
jgi:two-component system chemotaxis sensor kinase CheA